MKAAFGFVFLVACSLASVSSFANSQVGKLEGLQWSQQEDGAVTITQPTVVFGEQMRRVAAKDNFVEYVCRYYGFESVIGFVTAAPSSEGPRSAEVVALNTNGTLDFVNDSFDSQAPVIEHITCK